MKTRVARKTARLAASLLALLLAVAMAGCQSATPASQQQSAGASSSASAAATEPAAALTFKDEITIDYYGSDSSYQGIIPGWLGKIVKDKFNMKINLISPNVSGQAIFQTRTAAGNLGDVIVIGESSLPDLVKAGLLLDMTDLVSQYGANLMGHQAAIKNVQTLLATDKIYAIPTDVSSYAATDPLPDMEGAMACSQNGGATYLRWDAYLAAGSPPMNSMDDVLNVFKLIQEQIPVSISGKQTYPLSFFKDWDGACMVAAVASFPSIYGYAMSPGTSTLMTYGDCTDFKTQRLDDDNGLYYKTLKLFFQANQLGLVDPDSPSQDWDTQTAKVRDGQVLFYWWPWASMAQYNNKTNGNADPPTGFEFIPIADAKYYDTGFNPLGQWSSSISIGSKTKDPVRMMAFIDWCASPEAMQLLMNGPKGLMWDVQDGQPVLTDFGRQAQLDNTVAVPEEYGGGTVADDMNSSHNYLATLYYYGEIDPNYNVPYISSWWPSVLSTAATKLDESWQAAMGANDMLDYCKKHNMLAVAPGNTYVPPTDSGDIKNERAQCSKAFTDASWQMVFAKDEAEFNSIWANLKTQLNGLGWENVVAVDMQLAKDYNAACLAMIDEK